MPLARLKHCPVCVCTIISNKGVIREDFGWTVKPVRFLKRFLKRQFSLKQIQIQNVNIFKDTLICLFGVLHRFQHGTGHIMTGSWKRRGNQYIQFVRVLYCKLSTNGKQLPAFPLEAVPGTELRPQRWEVRVLPLCHHGPLRIL